MVYKRRAPLTSDEVQVISIASRNRLRLASLFEAIFEVFRSQNGGRNPIFEPFFSMLFWNAFWYRFWLDFLRPKSWKIAISLRQNNDFCKIGVFDKNTKKARFRLHFRRPKRRKNPRKSHPKTRCFLTSDFNEFSDILAAFWGPKIHEKFKKFEKIEVGQRFLKHYCFAAAFKINFEALRCRF